MKLTQIDHIGIAVHSLEESIPFYRDILGLPYLGTEEVPSEEVRVAFFAVGEVRIELLEPLSPNSSIAKHLATRGEGFHHIAYRVKSIHESLNDLKDKGVQLIHEKPKQGAHGAQIAFLHPRSTGKVLVELCQQAKGE
jgi:methylmalonyl-CoA epimerase